MASTISYSAIDENYPVAGQDNDSQGFRDNFDLIKTGLQTAQSEISTLQSDTAKLNQANDFAGNNITSANRLKGTSAFYNGGVLSGNTNISFENGHYQNFTINNTGITLTLVDWPASGKLAKITVSLTGRGAADVITWNTENSGTIKVATGFPNTPTIDSNVHPKIFEFWTVDGGTIVYGEYKGEFSTTL